MSTLHPLVVQAQNLSFWEQQQTYSDALLQRDKEIKRLRLALAFYADPVWGTDVDQSGDPFLTFHKEDGEGGEMAREALEKNP